MLYTIGDNLSSIVCVDNASNYGRVDIRNYFIHRMGKISTNIVWTCAKIMPIKFKDFEWLEYLTTFTKMLSIEQYECYVLFSLYPKYMMESNVRYFIANLQSFTYMTLIWTTLWNIRLLIIECHLKRFGIKMIKDY